MAAKAKMLEDLFHETLKDIYFAKKQIPACSKSLRTPNTALICTPSDAGRAFRPGGPAPHHAMKARPSTVCTVQSERALLL